MVRMELQYLESELIGLAIHKSLADQHKLVDAKKAFRGAYAATTDIPIIGPVLAPIAGATAFAAVMAFERGGIVPKDTLAMLHRNEMVLPAHVSNDVMNAVENNITNNNTAFRQSAGIVYAPTIHINAIDRNGVDEMLTTHEDAFVKKIEGVMRRRG